MFGHSAGSQSWKQFLHPPQQRLWSADASGFTPAKEEPVRLAFLGVRACDLAAIATLGRVLGGGAHTDTGFTRRRAGLFVIAAGCTEPGGVCFCASMGTGPEPGPGYDLSLTERIDGTGHRFLVDVGTEEGRRVLAMIGHRPAAEDEVREARDAVRAAAGRDGPADAGHRSRRAAARQPRVAALGRDRRPLPDLRQLHDGLPDLLLHNHRGQHRPGRRRRR